LQLEVAQAVDASTIRPVRSTRRSVLATAIPGADTVAILSAIALYWHGFTVTLVFGAAVACLLTCSGSQRLKISLRLEREIPVLLTCIALPFLVIAAFAANTPEKLESVAHVALAAAVLVVLGRGLVNNRIRAARERSWAPEPTLVVGAGEVGAMVVTTLREHREYGLVPVGFLDSFDGVGLSMPILGDAHALAATIERNAVTKVIVAFGAMGEADMVDVLRACDRLPVEVYVVPRFFELGVTTGRDGFEDLWGIPLLRLRRSALKAAASRSKRLFDIVLATIMLVLSSPLFLAAAVAVRRSSPGPIFLRQRRIGQEGREFELLKFRSMMVHDGSDTSWLASDTHMTRIGRILRRTNIDELPQLLNVLRGDMSVVGPRPERPHFANQFMGQVRRYNDRHRVPVGITGWAQVHGLRGDTPIPDRVRFDNYYIEHWSLWRDVVIVAQTIGKLLTLR
jgi:exopolysaccharide biosynthesis polyprenyl glycosylphosphotransferase